MAVFTFDGSGVSGRRNAAGLAALALVSIGAVALWRLQPEPTPPLGSTGEARTYSCDSAVLGDDESGRARALEICRRQAADAAERRPLVSGAAPMDPTAVRIHETMLRAVCNTGTGFTCPQPRTADAEDVEFVRRVLRNAGYPDATVRLARPDDPAPDGSVVYAVRIPDDTCVVAFAAMGSGASMNGVAGPLPDGGCLKV